MFIGSHARARPIRAHYDRLAIWPARAALPPVCGRSGHRPGRVARGSCANRCHPDHEWRLDSVQRASSHPDSACSPNQRGDNGRRTLFATRQKSARRCTGLGRCFKDHQSAFLLSQRNPERTIISVHCLRAGNPRAPVGPSRPWGAQSLSLRHRDFRTHGEHHMQAITVDFCLST